ncbi:structure-specific endonuclease subunit slx1 [Quercus suber]|uniref:Structure-specific endonuclease subunit slx1 n=3 Tax=Quercus suber TaxID=58331 RepID=A0AAW0L334_QUESU
MADVVLFEWAWQHPHESLAVRKAAANFKSLSGIANKVKLAYTMLTLPAWQSLNITVNFFSTKYTTHSAGCPSLPEHMKVQVCSMDELPCYTEIDESLSENEDDWANKEECDEVEVLVSFRRNSSRFYGSNISRL